MRINRALNLVVPVETGAGTVYLHSSPLSREAFEGSFRIIAAAHADIFGRGGAYIMSGPRVAALTLRSVGRAQADAEGREGDTGATALLGELRRLTVVIAPGANGWDTLPVDTAVQRGVIEAEDWTEVENALAFFMLVYWMEPRSNVENAMTKMAGLMKLSIVSSSPTEFIASLQTSTPAALTGAALKVSSIPS